MPPTSPWVIFDADNTLWAVEHLYDEARSAMCAYLASLGLSAADANRFQRERDKELHKTYGYSACRFARSFEDTLSHFRPTAATEEIRHVRSLALNVFEQRVEPEEGLSALLDQLVSEYRLGIITAGERWVQERRLNAFHLRDRFAAIVIVESKSESVFRKFCEEHYVAPSSSWVVGDSLTSDVFPALKAGMKAVFLRTATWEHENHEQHAPGGVPEIMKLSQLSAVLGFGQSRNG